MKKIKTNILIAIIALFSINLSAEVIWVGITPWQKGQTEDEINRLYVPMIKYLSKETGEEFKIKPMASYEQTIDFIASGKIQLAMISPAPYIKAKKENPEISILVTELSWNHDKTVKKDSYRGQLLINKKNKDLISIEAIKGKSIGFVSEESTSGYKIPLAHFKSLKINPKDYFSKVLILGSHPSVTDALAAGSIDVGATWDFNWQQAIVKHGDIFQALWESEPIPNLCVVAHPQINKKLQEKIKKLLIEIPASNLEGLSSVGFVAKPDSFYDSVRKINKALESK